MAYGIDSRKFCCCLPVRLGVFVLSFFSFLGGGFLAGAIWYEFSREYSLPGVQKAAFIIAGVSWSALALFSLAGLIGSIVRNRTLVAMYATFMWIHFWFDVAASAFFIYALYAADTTDYVAACVNQSNGQLNRDKCLDVLKWVRIIYIVVVVFLSLIQLYCSIIVSRYVAQLSDEAAFKTVSHLGNAGFAPAQGQASYYPHQALARSDPDEHHELHSQKASYDGGYHHQGAYNPPAPGTYAYTDPHNAFGNNAHKV